MSFTSAADLETMTCFNNFLSKLSNTNNIFRYQFWLSYNDELEILELI